MGLVAPQHVGSSRTRDWTWVSCVGLWRLLPLSHQGSCSIRGLERSLLLLLHVETATSFSETHCRGLWRHPPTRPPQCPQLARSYSVTEIRGGLCWGYTISNRGKPVISHRHHGGWMETYCMGLAASPRMEPVLPLHWGASVLEGSHSD